MNFEELTPEQQDYVRKMAAITQTSISAVMNAIISVMSSYDNRKSDEELDAAVKALG